ncbi:MAG: hypothetical protein ACRDD7_15255 [Peptostreptococcaceae bacterium]
MSDNLKNQPSITLELLREYFTKLVEKSILTSETMFLSKQIKHEMKKADRRRINMYGYNIHIETKRTPNDEFIRLMYKNKLDYLIVPTIPTKNLKKAKRLLKISDADFEEKYSKEGDTEWLYVREEGKEDRCLSHYHDYE